MTEVTVGGSTKVKATNEHTNQLLPMRAHTAEELPVAGERITIDSVFLQEGSNYFPRFLWEFLTCDR